MTARRDRSNSLELARCQCGRVPAHRVDNPGDARLYWIECGCGLGTEKSERPEDVIGAWNDREVIMLPMPTRPKISRSQLP